MNYVAFVIDDGQQTRENVAVMNRDLPAYIEEMERRGVRLLGRELERPNTAATVRVREGEVLVSDGPFAETKEHLGGLDLVACADLDEAIEVEAKSPVAQFIPFEIRPVRGELRLGPGASAFARDDDSAGSPYMLIAWLGRTPAGSPDDQAMRLEYETWQHELEAKHTLILGAALESPETATTLRFRDGELQLSDGPFFDLPAFIASIDIVSCGDRQEAIELAAANPLARHHAIEVRPFYTE